MMPFTDLSLATLDQLTDELAAAGWDSTHVDAHDARQAVARLINEVGYLQLYDSETGDLITSEVSDDQASDSCLTVEGHILVDVRNDVVLRSGMTDSGDFRRVYVAE
jgi:hypothetical protein